MKKLICTRGAPASGKTTWAKNEVECNGAVRFNKDDIRKELSGQDEKVVVEIERDRVERAIKEGINYIIVENTHLQYKDGTENKHIDYYRNLCKEYNYSFEIKEFYVSEEVAILRNKIRALEGNDSVSEAVIHKFFRDFKTPTKFPANPTFIPYKEGLPEAIIVDIDGTLAFMDGKRSPYDYSKVGGDRMNNRLYKLLQRLGNGEEIIIVSGRKDECRVETEKWLEDNGIFGVPLYMRDSDDNRCDTIVKEEIYREYIEGKYNVLAVFDDRNKVVDMRRRLGLPTYAVWYGNF